MLSLERCGDDLAAVGSATAAAAPVALAPPTRHACEARDPFEAEALLLNLQASLRVYSRSHFFAWTQGLLQRRLRHEVLTCLLRAQARQPYGIDSFSTRVADASVFGAALRADLTLVPRLVDAWRDQGHLPVAIDLHQAPGVARSAWARALESVGAHRLLVHGCHDAEAEPTGLYLFAVRGDDGPTARAADDLQLLVPLLHAAWLRTRLQPPPHRADDRPRGEAVVSTREHEILKWIYLGKNNVEIGLILGISPLTVKNHVQHLLRKLDVVNRAQAVGKALDGHILRP